MPLLFAAALVPWHPPGASMTLGVHLLADAYLWTESWLARAALGVGRADEWSDDPV